MIKDPIYILNIETATKNCSVSLAKNGKVIVLKEFCEAHFSHAEKLHLFIKEVLVERHLEFNNLSAIAISKGPGSYTGLRIGVSSAKGLCFALDIPLISIPTLEALAHATSIENGFIIPMLDARRQEVFTAIFDSKYQIVKKTYNYILDENSYSTYLNNSKIVFIGDGVTKTKNLINHNNAIFIEDVYPSAKEMSPLSFIKFKNKDFENVAYFEPFYLKDFHVTVSNKNLKL